jgi:hypothetical protein
MGMQKSFRIFLSHRYESAEINLFFFELFEQAKIANLQFEVDKGTFATNVTRLERMVRGANAFLGIYPFSGGFDAIPSKEDLLRESRYFRLELDLAIRSRKPAMIFSDKRYRAILKAPGTIRQSSFDPQEIMGAVSSPSSGIFRRTFAEFCETIEASMSYENTCRRDSVSADVEVGVLLPPEKDGVGYSQEQIHCILEQLRESSYYAKKLDWPGAIGLDFHLFIESLDWIVIDVGEESARTGIPAYLHGRFIPTMRLKQLGPGEEIISPLEQALFGGFEVGYKKDIVRWRELEELRSGLSQRLARLNQGGEYIRTSAEAYNYFRGAMLRKEAVFLSYSGEDADVAKEVAKALKKHFQTVYDYRDGKSLQPGNPWISQIFDQLSGSAVGVPLLSHDYLASGNCMHEAQEMAARHDSKRMQLLPVKVRDEALDLPSWLGSLQYVRLKDLGSDYSAVAKSVLSLLEKRR